MEKNTKEALELYRHAAEGGLIGAMNGGEGVEKNGKEGRVVSSSNREWGR